MVSAQVLSPYYWHDPRAVVSAGVLESGRDSVTSSTTILVPTASMSYSQVDSNISGDSYRSATISFVLTKVSGTVAGSVYLQGSVDGMNWTNINDTITLANATTNKYIWELPGKQRGTNGNGKAPYSTPAVLPYLYYRSFIAGTGTWCGTFNTCWVPRN